jgi:hypothetical protein
MSHTATPWWAWLLWLPASLPWLVPAAWFFLRRRGGPDEPAHPSLGALMARRLVR